MARALILGCGYTGRRLARRLLDDGHRVAGTTRDPDRARALEESGVEPVLLDVADPESVRGLAGLAPEVAFYLIPPLRTGDAVGSGADSPADAEGAGHGAGGAAEGAAAGDGAPPGYRIRVGEVIDVLGRAPLECFVYVSSTSVYGDRGGARVDETAEPRPDSDSGRARLAAERVVLERGWSRDARPRIARVAGIYGPGRTMSERIRSGRYRVVRGNEAVTNRIHVDDLAAGLHAVWRRGRDGRIYNMSDGDPRPSAEFARIVAEHLGVELSEIGRREAEERYSEGRLSRTFGSKRVDNRRLTDELGVELRYPSIREGVPAALGEEASAGPG